MSGSIQFLALLSALITPVNEPQAQTPRKPGAPEKPLAKFQVDFRIQVAPDLDKQQLLIWMNLLKELGAAGVSQVPVIPALPRDGEKDEPAIQAAGPNRVEVRAILGPSGNLFIGTEGYRIADRAKLGGLIKSMQADGVPGPDPGSPMWGLNRAQMDILQTELSPPSRFELKGQTLDSFLAQLRGRIKLEIKVSPEGQQYGKSIKLTATTGELSTGAALAYLLGQNGLAWEPRASAGGGVTVLVLTRDNSKRPWPVGLTPEQMPGNIAPNLMASARYQTSQTPLNDVLDVFRRELKMDVLLDRAALLDRDINPDALRSTIQIPNGTLSSAMRKTLAPMGLKYELRIDESNRAFLWVTAGEPTGPLKKKG
jgi:hypothetical protein